MRLYSEYDLRMFDFWSGAADRVKTLTYSDWDIIEPELEVMYPEGMSTTELNDLFWFEFDMIAQMLGYENEADMDRKRDPSYIDDDELTEKIPEWWADFLEGLDITNDKETIVFIATDLFDYWEEDEVGEYQDPEPEDALDYLQHQTDAEDLFNHLFNDDCGHDLCSKIPTWEEFRDEMMNA